MQLFDKIVNRETLWYHAINRLKKWLGLRDGDDWDWGRYNLHYRGELKEIAKSHALVIGPGDFTFSEGRLSKARKESLDLHPNHRLLYETVLQLEASSVLELGCGGGDHLHNLSLLRPQLELHGRDRSPEQLAFLKERHPSLRADVMAYDCTTPFPADAPAVDLAYTQAVLMHIQQGDGHRVALANLFRVARRQIVLMESWGRHDFMGDIQRLHAAKTIAWNWKELYFHYRESPELGRPHLMIVSSQPLAAYPRLDDYRVLTGA